MAYDKVIDSAALDAGLTATANAIREKTGGTSPIAWDSAKGFQAAIEGIADGGVELPELGDTAAAPGDMAAGKVLYDDEGNPVTGILADSAAGNRVWAADDIAIYENNIGSTKFHIGGVYSKANIGSDTFHGFVCRPGVEFWLRNVPSSLFGNAAATQVAKGVTFTSEAGLLAEGELEEIAAGRSIGAKENVTVVANSDGTMRIMAKTNWGDNPGCIVRSGANLSITAPASSFDDIFPTVELTNGILSIR